MTTSLAPFLLFLVDDSEIMRRYLTALLRGANFLSGRLHIVEASAYEEGLLRVATHLKSPFCGGLLTDFQLGSTTGLQLALDLKKMARVALQNPAFDFPAAVMTQGGKLPKEDQAQAENSGILVLSKPGPQDLDSFIAALKSQFKISP